MNKEAGFSAVVIVAGGSGSRMGRPKQMLPLAGEPALVHTVRAFKACPCVGQIIVVTPEENQTVLSHYFKDVSYALPGDTRLASVINGVHLVLPQAHTVAVHDGARPLVRPQDIESCLACALQTGAAVLAVPVKDTIKQAHCNVVQQTLERSTLWAAQTPQCYRTEVLVSALAKWGHLQNATDESQLVEKNGTPVTIVEGSYTNFKITTPEDLLFAEAYMQPVSFQRTGFGFDLHRLTPGRKLFIGGAEIPHDKGFLGHSDGDVVLHAVCDAILGALCEGEIGVLFPPTDKSIEGISSVTIAKKVLEIVRARGAELLHIDATIVTEEPKIKPHYATVRASLARVFEMQESNVSFKSKSHERVGEIGQGQAAMCHAVATLIIRSN